MPKTMSEFGVTKYMAFSAKKLVEDKGVLSTQTPRQVRHLVKMLWSW